MLLSPCPLLHLLYRPTKAHNKTHLNANHKAHFMTSIKHTRVLALESRVKQSKKIILENCALLGNYAASSGNFLLMFWEKCIDPKFRVQWSPWIPKMGPIACLEKSVRIYHTLLRNDPEECSSHLFRGGSLKSRSFFLDSLTLEGVIGRTEISAGNYHYTLRKIPE